MKTIYNTNHVMLTPKTKSSSESAVALQRISHVLGDFPTLSPQRVLPRGTINGSTFLLLNPSHIYH